MPTGSASTIMTQFCVRGKVRCHKVGLWKTRKGWMSYAAACVLAFFSFTSASAPSRSA